MRSTSLAAKVALLLFVAIVPNAHAKKGRLARFVPGEVIVKFREETSGTKRLRALNVRGHEMHGAMTSGGLAHVRLGEGQSVEGAIAAYAGDATVEYVQPNYYYHLHKAPNDPDYGQLWGLKNSGQKITAVTGAPDLPFSTHNPGVSGKDMSLEGAWDVITDCSAVTVAVVDSGVNYKHQDLKDNMWNGGAAFPNHGYDFANDDNDPRDENGHGTHVAGTIAAKGNNNTGSAGLCWKASLMAVRVADSSGSATTANLVKGVDFAVDHGAKIINISMGGAGKDPAFEASITRAGTKGVVIVVSAGNDGLNNDVAGNETYPCNYPEPNLVCVAALDQSYALASFSNYGTTSVDIAAPGVNIVSSWSGTETMTKAAMNSGWTMTDNGSGSWAFANLGSNKAPVFALANPANLFAKNVTYAKGADDLAYRSFDLSGADVATVDIAGYVNTEYTKDFVKLWCKGAGGDPTAGGKMLDELTGHTGTTKVQLSYDMSDCIGPSASFGFQFTSDNNGTNDSGVGITAVGVRKLAFTDSDYNVISGTSMATPHVTGLVTMLFAQNPDYATTDVLEALKNGGTSNASQNGKTVAAKAANALGSLAYIQQPTGLTVTK